MTERMAKLDRLLALVHALSDTTEGLTLDEMAGRLDVNRRTAERMRDVIARHFDLDEIADDRRKRFLIRDSLRRAYTRPTAAEVAALRGPVQALTGGDESPAAVASAVELVLEGLHLSKRLNKDALGARSTYRARA